MILRMQNQNTIGIVGNHRASTEAYSNRLRVSSLDFTLVSKDSTYYNTARPPADLSVKSYFELCEEIPKLRIGIAAIL